MAGFTHSAFRRLLAEQGGCGALWTEMLAARQILNEDFHQSPWVRRRPTEPFVVYQLMARALDPLDRVLDRLGEHGADAVDLNLACDAHAIRARASGSALFENLEALTTVVTSLRRHWPGLLTAKIRLGARHPDWQARFTQRIRILEACGADALVLHPRFFEDKFRGRARHEHLAWVSTLTRLPLIANGDLTGPESVHAQAKTLQPAAAIMIGRMAIAQPWIFAAWNDPHTVDPADFWRRLHDHVLADFPPTTALRRLQTFTKYFAANYAFGHRFWVDATHCTSLEALRDTAQQFFDRKPARLRHPVVAGR